MNNQVLRVTPAQLLETAQEMENQISCMKDYFSGVFRQMDYITAYWKGPASEFRQEAFSKQKPDQEELLKRLTEDAEMLREIAANYTKGKNDNKEQMEALPGDVIE